ncbi:MAG: cation:proton antiporter [Armatimonadota bacterium]
MDTAHTLLFLIIIVAAAKLAGGLSERLGQPAVLGELGVGVALSFTPLKEAAGDPAITFLAAIGIILLLFETGLESELDELRHVGISAGLVAVVGVVLPMLAGFGVLLAVEGDYRHALFVGAILTATSVGITARVLSDLGQTNSKEARIILGAAVIDDILGLLILGVVLQIVAAGRPDAFAIVRSGVLSIGFLVLAIWLGMRLAPKLISLAQRLRVRGILVTTAFVYCIGLAYLAEQVGLAEIVGAFAAGLVLATTDDRVHIQTQVRPITDIFIPVFFVLVGLQVRLGQLNPLEPGQRSMLLVGLALLVLAVLGKLAAGVGVTNRGVNRMAVGAGMVPRGEVGLIFASIGLREGLLPPDLYAVMVLIVFISTLVGPFWLKRALRSK